MPSDDFDLDDDPFDTDTDSEELGEELDEFDLDATDDGDDESVEPEELNKGYMRQADYTRKTQELARLRSEAEMGINLVKALEMDPHGTFAVLAQQFGLVADDSEMDPYERQAAALESRLNNLEAQTRAADLEAKATAALAAHGIDGHPDHLVTYMIQHNIGNPDAAARLMALDLETEVKNSRKEKVTAAKRGNPVQMGGTRKAANVAPKTKMSIAEAAKAARQGLVVAWDDDEPF